MPLPPDITIIRRHIRVNARDYSYRTENDDELERNEFDEEVGRAHHPHLPAALRRDRIARSEDGDGDGGNDVVSGRSSNDDENGVRVRNCYYRHVPSIISPSSNRYDDRHSYNSPRQQQTERSTFHTPSRQLSPPSRAGEQNDEQRRQPSYRVERYENIVYTTTTTTTTSEDQSDQSRQPSYRVERYEKSVYSTTTTTSTTSLQAPPPPPREEPSDDQTTTHFSRHRTEWSENTTTNNSPRKAPPPREPTQHQGRNFNHRTEWSENTTTNNSPRQAPPPREPTQHQGRNNFSHRTTRRRSDHTPPPPHHHHHHHHHHSPRQAPGPGPGPSSRERPHQQSEYYSFNNPHTSTSTSTPPSAAPVAPRGGGGGDLYRILKVSPEASQAEIVNAARRRRIEVHPDRLRMQYPGAMTQSALDAIDDQARNVGLAADTLCDEVSRRSYDRAVRRGLRS